MKTFFSKITQDHWTAKNNLEKAAHKVAKEMERWIVTNDEVPRFKKDFQEKINALNMEHKRCKPLRFSIEGHQDRNGDIAIWCDGVFNMSLLLAKNG